MKLFIKSLIIASVGCLFFYTCTIDKSTNPIEEDNPIYYPGTEGSYYKYEIIQTDTSNYPQNEFRIVHIVGDTSLNRTLYKIQIDSVQRGDQISVSTSYFRNTESGVFYFVDMTGFSNILPDTIQSSIDLQSEMRAYLFPLATGSSWPVYRISFQVNDFFSFNLVDISGKYFSDEIIDLNLLGQTQTINTKKVEFTLKIQTDTSVTITTFNAFAWLAEDVGVVKSEGDAVVLSIFGGALELFDTSATVVQNLIEYDVK